MLSEDCFVQRVREVSLKKGVHGGSIGHRLAGSAMRVQSSVKADRSLGEGAGLVGAQSVHASEVLDRVRPLGASLFAAILAGLAMIAPSRRRCLSPATRSFFERPR
jgi:hypothetical protein